MGTKGVASSPATPMSIRNMVKLMKWLVAGLILSIMGIALIAIVPFPLIVVAEYGD